MKRKRFRNAEEFYGELERRWLKTARPPSRAVGAINTFIFVVVLAALLVVAYVNRVRIGALWQQMTGKTLPVRLVPEKPKHRERHRAYGYLCGVRDVALIPRTWPGSGQNPIGHRRRLGLCTTKAKSG